MEQPTAKVAGETDTAEASPARPKRKLAWWAWVAAYVTAGVTLFFCYRWLSETQAVTSDGAANALQAWAMLHGDPLLRGWIVGDVSFYTTELPEYMGVELIRGLGPDVVHVAAAFTYTLLVLLAGLLAKGRARGREALVRVLIASGIMIAPQLHFGASIVLLGADHTGTEVPLLATWLVVDRAPRRWYVPLIITVMLAWVQIADSITLLVAIVPLVLVCVLRICHGLVRRKPLTSLWYEAALAVAAAASVYAAWLAVHVIHRLGGYVAIGLPTLPAILRTVPDHLRLTADGVLVLYGADFSGLHPGVAAAFAAVHLVGLALAVWAFGLAIWRFFRIDDLVVQVLTVRDHHQLGRLRVQQAAGNRVHLPADRRGAASGCRPGRPAAVRPDYAAEARASAGRHPGLLCGGPRIRCRAAGGSRSRSGSRRLAGRPSPDDRSYRLEREHPHARHRRARSTPAHVFRVVRRGSGRLPVEGLVV